MIQPLRLVNPLLPRGKIPSERERVNISLLMLGLRNLISTILFSCYRSDIVLLDKEIYFKVSAKTDF